MARDYGDAVARQAFSAKIGSWFAASSARDRMVSGTTLKAWMIKAVLEKAKEINSGTPGLNKFLPRPNANVDSNKAAVLDGDGGVKHIDKSDAESSWYTSGRKAKNNDAYKAFHRALAKTYGTRVADLAFMQELKRTGAGRPIGKPGAIDYAAGVPLTDREGGAPVLPDRITIYRQPILESCQTRRDVAREIRITLWET